MRSPTRTGKTGGPKKRKVPTKMSERARLVHELMGKYAYWPFSSDDHARQKERELELED